MHPPDPEMRKGCPAKNSPDRNFENNQPSEITPTARQAQHLRRLYALTSATAYAVAELAFAGLPR
jgi:hypothetical protein